MAEQKVGERRVVKVSEKFARPPTAEMFDFVTEPMPELQDGQVAVKALYITVDPYLIGRLGQWKGKPVNAGQVAVVLDSKDEGFKAGDHVFGYFDWATASVVHAKQCNKVPTPSKDGDQKEDIPLSYHLGAFGMPGRTAYYGLFDIGQLKENSNVFISGAAGAVGSAAGQMAKLKGCRVVGTAGTKEKLDWITTECGYDQAFNYKDYSTPEEFTAELKKAFPNGIDLYFDNVGGLVTEAVWPILNKHSVVVICGQISMYLKEPPKIQDFLRHLIYREIRVQGISVMEMKDVGRFYRDMKEWIQSGQIKVRETVIEGFDRILEAFFGLFTGVNIGKMVVKL